MVFSLRAALGVFHLMGPPLENGSNQQPHIFLIETNQSIGPWTRVLDVGRFGIHFETWSGLLWNGSQGNVGFALPAGACVNTKAAAEAATHTAVRFVAYDKP